MISKLFNVPKDIFFTFCEFLFFSHRFSVEFAAFVWPVFQPLVYQGRAGQGLVPIPFHFLRTNSISILHDFITKSHDPAGRRPRWVDCLSRRFFPLCEDTIFFPLLCLGLLLGFFCAYGGFLALMLTPRFELRSAPFILSYIIYGTDFRTWNHGVLYRPGSLWGKAGGHRFWFIVLASSRFFLFSTFLWVQVCLDFSLRGGGGFLWSDIPFYPALKHWNN